jgi:hypothetical protein
MLHVNVPALTELPRRFLPGMIERRSGRIMNMRARMRDSRLVAGRKMPGPREVAEPR